MLNERSRDYERNKIWNDQDTFCSCMNFLKNQKKKTTKD